MKPITVAASEVGKYGRMDARFFLALDSVKERMAALEARLTQEQALELLRQTPAQALVAVDALGRGQKKLSTQDREKLCEEYPWIALALIEKELEGNSVKLQEKIEQLKAEQDRLHAVQAALREEDPPIDS